MGDATPTLKSSLSGFLHQLVEESRRGTLLQVYPVWHEWFGWLEEMVRQAEGGDIASKTNSLVAYMQQTDKEMANGIKSGKNTRRLNDARVKRMLDKLGELVALINEEAKKLGSS